MQCKGKECPLGFESVIFLATQITIMLYVSKQGLTLWLKKRTPKFVAGKYLLTIRNSINWIHKRMSVSLSLFLSLSLSLCIYIYIYIYVYERESISLLV